MYRRKKRGRSDESDSSSSSSSDWRQKVWRQGFQDIAGWPMMGAGMMGWPRMGSNMGSNMGCPGWPQPESNGYVQESDRTSHELKVAPEFASR